MLKLMPFDSVARYSLTGIVTNPNWMAPFHIERGTATSSFHGSHQPEPGSDDITLRQTRRVRSRAGWGQVPINANDPQVDPVIRRRSPPPLRRPWRGSNFS